MEVIPAIDLRGGRVVRLYQGDFRRETVFSEDPISIAKHWQAAGAPRIHIVDLDGAKSGSLVNLDVVGRIAAQVAVPLQMGGGIRTLDTARKVVRMGVERLIIGTAAVMEPKVVGQICQALSRESVVVGIDASDGQVAIQGWSERTSTTATELMREMAALGVGRFVYTDIARDGTLQGPNLHAIESLVKELAVPIIASGGISSLEDLENVARIGVEGVIVGSALYRGTIDLRQAIERFGG